MRYPLIQIGQGKIKTYFLPGGGKQIDIPIDSKKLESHIGDNIEYRIYLQMVRGDK